ncbi:Molecular chaperone, DnaJ family protein, partial [Giardia duodenalis]
VCMCELDAVLTKGICAPVKTLTKKKLVAIAAGTTMAVLVVGVLVGFLCWWFLCRGKRIGASPSTTALVRPKSV